jgi:hypothetical protein
MINKRNKTDGTFHPKGKKSYYLSYPEDNAGRDKSLIHSVDFGRISMKFGEYRRLLVLTTLFTTC